MKINDLFDSSKDIYRAIEKVITYNASQESRLRTEITEYIVTESIEDHFEKLLTKMQAAMEMGGENDVGVWVSGFYGSGKSSFTKYLGLALDDSIQVDGVRFLKHLQDRMNKPQTKALLATVANRHPAAVVMLDLASEMLAGATMEDVSTVLYYKVLQWAGYSRNLKVAALERRLQKDGRLPEFRERIRRELDVAWEDVQNDPLIIDSVLPQVAHELYPALFRTSVAFNTETADFVRFENERVMEMIDIVREKTDKQYILFIVDEVGQYVGSRPSLILNLDGLAKNLKTIGGGKVWIMGTAQQTLTEDDPRTALNSPELYKLKDRFPIQVELESSDIKEICYRRLLGKSAAGEQTLGALFDRCGAALRHNTKLEDARYYEADFDRQTFINLYPFLPAHFDILLHLLGTLAKSTGGIGLRSAIKVIQDILIEGPDGHAGTIVADQAIGWLATTVTLFDALERDIRRGSPSTYKSVSKVVEIRFPHSSIHKQVAKTVAILQILNNLPVTAQNIASLMQSGVDAPSCKSAVEAAIQDLIADPFVPFGEKDGNLCFFSEKVNEIDQERGQIPRNGMETRRIQNEALRQAFTPLPSSRLHGSLTVTAGLRVVWGGSTYNLANERETIQTVVEFVDPGQYDAARVRLVDESRQRSAQHTIFLLGRAAPEAADKALEIYRCNMINQRYRNDTDQEVKDYCNAQADRSTRLLGEFEQLLKRLLSQGSFIFRGQTTAVDSLDHDVLEAARKHLDGVVEQVFDRYIEAPVRAETALAEKFLRAGRLTAINSTIDPMGLVQMNGGTARINTGNKSLVSVRDAIERNGTLDGKRLIETFTDAPFGWSQDTLRYLVAALLVASEIKLKVSGREVTVNGQQAIEALRTNNSFKNVGVSLRELHTPNEVLARAATRLTDLIGETVLPFPEDEISKAAAKYFPQFQLRYGSLAAKLDGLGLPGADSMRALNQELADVLLTDASDAPQRMGGEESLLYQRLSWAAEVNKALNNGLEATVRELQQHRQEIGALPESSVPGELRATLADTLDRVGQRLAQDNFHRHVADLNSALTAIKTRTGEATVQMIAAQKQSVRERQQELLQVPEWTRLLQDQQSAILAQLDELGNLADTVSHDLRGLKQLLNHEYVIQSRTRDLKREAAKLAHQQTFVDGVNKTHTVKVPANIRSVADLDELIGQLQTLKQDLSTYADVDIIIRIGDGPEA